MKTCIWCLKTEPVVTFDKRAHTFPKALGGRKLCKNVCDQCNLYFGSKQKGSPSVEVILKEALNLSRHVIHLHHKEARNIDPYKSEYFRFNKNTYTISINNKYKFERNFQERLGRLFKRGLYKVYLEERERELGDSRNERFNFIRSFARYDLNDPPVYYVIPVKGLMFTSNEDLTYHSLKFTAHVKKMDEELRAYELSLYGHTFILPLSQSFEQFYLDVYKKYFDAQNHLIRGNGFLPIVYFDNVDFAHVRRFGK